MIRPPLSAVRRHRLVLAVGALAIALSSCTLRAPDDSRPREVMLGLAQLRDQARLACGGNGNAFNELRDLTKDLKPYFDALESSADQAQWKRLDVEVTTMLAHRDAVQSAHGLGDELEANSAPLAARLDELLDALVRQGDSAATVRAAGRVQLLLVRQKARIATILTGGDAAVPASDGLGRDQKLLVALLAALRDGSTELGIKAVKDADTRSLLGDIAQSATLRSSDIERLQAVTLDLQTACEKADSAQADVLPLLMRLQRPRR